MAIITENIQTYDYSVKLMPGVTFPVRSTFLSVDNALIIISPGPFFDPEIISIVEKYETVYCIAPNAFHHLHLLSFHQRFPNISIYGPKAVEKKQPMLAGKVKSLDDLSSALAKDVQFIPIGGSAALGETVFYCTRSKSLIVTDLVFNMRSPMPFGRKCILSLVGAKDKIAQSKLVKKSIKDKPAYLESISLIKELEVKRIVPAHGDIIEGEVAVNIALEAMNAV